ncbi:hypothetical protein RAS1_04980 [Phycisphaerae bacterium RAS1]|nr:hypothetical protein RAS1_04980 [Phycisphaerae bacterium RAS1]
MFRKSLTKLVGLVVAVGLAAPVAPAAFVEFNVLAPAGPWGCCGVTFTADGVGFVTRQFQNSAGTWVVTGSAYGGGCLDPFSLYLNNVSVAPNIVAAVPGGATTVIFDYRDMGGNINLRVNGIHVRRADFSMIPGAAYAAAGVAVGVTTTAIAGGVEGTVTLTGGPITSVWIGGQELCIDELDMY